MDDVMHKELHDKMESIEHSFYSRHNTLVKWLATSLVTILLVGMAQIVSVAQSLSKIDGMQSLIISSLARLDSAIIRQEQRIQEESREAERDLSHHRQEDHN